MSVQGEDCSQTTNYAGYVSTGNGLESVASVEKDGRISVIFDLKKGAAEIPCEDDNATPVKEFAVDSMWTDCPTMNIVIMIVGSRGDVQPYVALGKQLEKGGHRVRIATHETFREFVLTSGLDFFSIGGNPQDLMSYMVKNPGLIPGYESLTNGDIGKKRKMLGEILHGCWQSCHLPSSSTSPAFIADAIISNPPAFAHIHCAEALGVPLLASFTMPWSPTTAFPHPLVNITTTNIGGRLSNFLSYTAAETLQWQGIGDIINNFRTTTLGIPPMTFRNGPGILDKLKVPWTYCMSPALVPKPCDWKNNIDVVGFYFLDLASSYTPPDDLAAFLNAGEPPVYVGFGSVVVDDAAAMTLFNATKEAGVRALVSAGWGGLGGTEVPPHVFMLGNIPHDWLFDNERVAAVVHHGGAGTTAIGLAKGRPTVVVPFFGDQGFWGNMIYKAGAGPEPIPNKELTMKKLRDGIKFAVSPKAKEAARILGDKIREENGVVRGVESFYKHLPLLNMRCDLDPSRLGVWWCEKHYLRLSTFAAQVLSDAKLIDMESLSPHRSKEYASEACKQTGNTLYDTASSALENITQSFNLSSYSRKGSGSRTSSKDGCSENKRGISDGPYSQSPVAEGPSDAKSGFFWSKKRLKKKSKDSETNSKSRESTSLPELSDPKPPASISPESTRPLEQKIRSTRIEEGKEAVQRSTPEEQIYIITQFEAKSCETHIRLKELCKPPVERGPSNGGFKDVNTKLDLRSAMKLSHKMTNTAMNHAKRFL